nr:putative gluconokinase [Quercus suber]
MPSTVVADSAVSHYPPTPPSELVETEKAESTSNVSASASNPRGPQLKHIWVITGPAGCGKTSVAEHLHRTFSLPYLEGDTFHTAENVQKMANGHPLTDADRWDWLILLREQALSTLATASGVIVTCSALKRKYRDVVRVAAYHDPRICVHFVYLNAAEAVLLDRVRGRQGHYMKDSMVHSQFQSLEVPQADERDVMSVDAGGTSQEVLQLAVGVVRQVMGKEMPVA